QPVKVRPPERFVLTAVIAARRGHQSHRCLFGSAVTYRDVTGELRETHRHRVVLLDLPAVGNWLGTQRCDAVFESPQQKPVAQRAGGPTVVVVVVFDLFEDGSGVIGATVA